MNEMMQEMSGRPSPTPTLFAPTNQPVAMEAPPAVASSEPPPSVMAVILLVVLASVIVALFVFRKYHRSTRPQRVPKQETEHAENPSASRVVANSRTTSSLDSKDDSETNKRNKLADAIERSFRFFPRILNGKSRGDFTSISALKMFLRDKVEDALLDEPRLRERRNGPALFLRMGMDERLVEKRFTALMQFEKELGIVGKLSFVDTIDLFIENIEFTNPFGEVNDAIQDLTENFSHLCLRMKRGHILSAIDKAANEIQRRGWENLFMHGTKAVIAVRLTKEPNFQLEHARGVHDFGPGLYCFRGHRKELIAALSFAVSRSFAYGENPCVVAFPEPLIGIDKRIINVNREKINERLLSRSLGEVRYGELVAAQNNWTADTKNWKTALCITRWFRRELSNFYKESARRTILMGWLHDTATTEETDTTRAQPQSDAEEWIQYCVKDLDLLGGKKLFIQFDVSKWEQWATEGDVDRDIMVAWQNHAESVASAQ